MDRMKQVALGIALLAFAIVTMTVWVVVSRMDKPAAASNGSPIAAIAPAKPASLELHVAAADIVKLRTTHVDTATDGIRIADRELDQALGLEADDVIVALSGRPLHRELDVIDALLTISMMSATSVYVELERGGDHRLLVWRVVGDLRTARADAVRLPPLSPVADPVVATIVAIDETHASMPGSTADRIVGDTPTYLTKAVRGYPWTNLGATKGLKLFAIRPGSVIEAVGIKNGDIVRAVNGTEVTSLDDLADQLVKTRRTNLWTLDLERRNHAMILAITIQ